MRDSSITNKERLEHMLEAISNIESFISGQSRENFLNSVLMQNAIMFQFTIIGEAVANIDKDLLYKYSYPWHNVRSLRSFILHEYHSIEIWIIWETAIYDLPKLKKLINAILENEF